MGRLFIVLGALGGFAGVATGASARHLAAGDPGNQDLLGIASHYLLIHGLALVVLAVLMQSARTGLIAARVAGIFFILGMVLFGGGLIADVFTNSARFVMMVPAGGTCFLTGWLALALHGVLRGRDSAA
jgi:uncharacterized membrane protein YgdD (TMEM256/DUF423 family)